LWDFRLDGGDVRKAYSMAWSSFMRVGRDKSATKHQDRTSSSSAISSAAMLRISASLADCAHTSSSPRSSCEKPEERRVAHNSAQPHAKTKMRQFGLPLSAVERQRQRRTASSQLLVDHRRRSRKPPQSVLVCQLTGLGAGRAQSDDR